MAQAIPLALAVAGTALSAGGTIIGSQAEGRELNLQAGQLDTAAGLERATSQRAAMEERRQARLANSRALAVAAASGGGADDPSVINAMAGIEGEGEYRALTALFNGEQSALGLEDEAAARRRGAKATKAAGLIRAGGTILSAGSSLYSRFGGGAPSGDVGEFTTRYGR
jgi:hypothetical protein